ncbi:hypothetical protein BDM02DRAFT_3113058 [Thelephora ganbajun]|uniref:Uncharacterized protein n=1 Tax=Thelephora ganbajun TaxID=370292 RepID=A0ACB6ZJQ6_THEGA|nr:hypothetical protein BDM02DRAFT_3113058 [Thelephora ganbajun]
MPWDNTPVLTDLIGSLAESPIRHLTITPFYMGRFQKTSLLRCFEPIADSLCSLELRFLKTYVPVLITLISMFPNLDDIFLDRVDATPMRWPYGERDFDFVPSFAGTFEYLDLYDGTQSFFLSWIMDFPLHFHTISPGVLAKDDLPTFSKLVTMCAPTLREIPYIMFGEDVQPEHVVDILSPCTNLRRVGVCGNQLYRMCPVVEAMLRSLRSRHISVIYLEIVETLRTLQIDKVWNDEGWGQFEDFLCQLAEERIDNGEPLVLELGIWRDPQLKAYGPLNPGTILPRFRERGLIKLAPPPEDLDCAAVLDVKYSGSRGVSSGILLALAGLSR